MTARRCFSSPTDAAAFRSAIERLCADASLRARMGAAARAAIERHGLTWANNARRIVGLFEELRMAGRGPLGAKRPVSVTAAEIVTTRD